MTTQVQPAYFFPLDGLAALAANSILESSTIDLGFNVVDILVDIKFSIEQNPIDDAKFSIFSKDEQGIETLLGEIFLTAAGSVQRRIYSLATIYENSIPGSFKLVFKNELGVSLSFAELFLSEVTIESESPVLLLSSFSAINQPGLNVNYSNGSGTKSALVHEGAVKISSINPAIQTERNELVLLSPSPQNFERFGSSLYVERNTSTKILLVGAPGTATTLTGAVYSFLMSPIYPTSTSSFNVRYNTTLNISDYTGIGIGTGTQWGSSIAGTDDAGYIAIGAPGFPSSSSNNGIVMVFTGTNTIYSQTLGSPFGTGARFGEKIAITPNGNYIFVTAPNARTPTGAYGKVAVYEKQNGIFTLTQIISNPVTYAGMKFGSDIDVNESADTVVISSVGTNRSVETTFDRVTDQTTFDSGSTGFFGQLKMSGSAYIYNKKMSKFILSEEIAPVSKLDGTSYGYSVALDDDVLFVGAPSTNNLTTASCVYQFNRDPNISSIGMKVLREQDDSVDVGIFDRVSLINSFSEELVDYLDIIDPLKGKIAGLADQEIKYKSAFDPAVYSIGVSGTVNDPNTNWLDDHVGELWWDLSTVKYLWYEQGDLAYRKNNWGRLFPGASIDVYEWVSSQYLPTEWSSRADTPSGLTEGISGQPRYPDNSVVSVKQVYDYVTNSFSNVYYYWVKNKITVPNVSNRRISGYQVASIIANPTQYGLKYASILSADSLSLSNVGSMLVDDRIHLNIAYDKNPTDIQRHTEWLLLQEGAANSRPNYLLEKKLFDSLLGHDSLGNLVPDPSLTERTRYGLGIRPQQTLFKNRFEALRNIIEFANGVLKENLITGNYSFKNLTAEETIPDVIYGEYDQLVDDNEGLLIINTPSLQRASLSCTVYNGKIRAVIIDNPGSGYRIAPTVTVDGNAVITTQIDSQGRIISTNIVDAGSGYVTPPTLVVRPYTVIVLSDNSYDGKWTKFIWDEDTSRWVRYHTQKYKTDLYWDYLDWISSDYNPYQDYVATVDDVYQINSLSLFAGDYVKIKNGGDNRFIILKKLPNGQAGSFGDQFDIVYSEKGTIKILDSIWDLSNSSFGFDQNGAYDQTLFDQFPDIELQYILTALKEDIFINDLKINYNLFFFRAVKYALSEQKLLDWAFKTSFINVTNYAGTLDQRPVYKLQNSSYFEDYLKEVKPFHTNIRNFTTDYTVLEPSNTMVTDFDLPSIYNQETEKFEPILADSPYLNEYPWKSWYDNYASGIGSIRIGNPGAGYTLPPSIKIITADGDTGSGATARAFISSGQVLSVEITNPGSGYKKSPIVQFVGGGDTLLTTAVAYAQLSNQRVRSNAITLKFDRINVENQIGNINTIDRFVCNGSQNTFVLNWAAKTSKADLTVLLDSNLVLGSDYILEHYVEDYNGYNKKYSKIKFTNFIPVQGQILEVRYIKDTDLLNATERIINYYQPTSGMPGNELGQLMTGVEYPKTQIDTIPFDYTTKWDIDTIPFGQASYADDVNFYTSIDLAQSAARNKNFFVLTTTTDLLAGQFVNIISTITNKFNDPLVSIVSVNTATRTVTFDSTLVSNLPAGTTVEFWSYNSDVSILDTAIDGGGWDSINGNYLGALGVNPEDIILDGDMFMSADASHAPEEFVPGQVADSIGINVYTKNSEGAPLIFSSTVDVYASNTTTVAKLGIIPPSSDYITVAFNNKLFAYSTTTNFTSSTQFAVLWDSNQIVIPPQSVNGKLGYTILSIGGGKPDTEAGVIDSDIVTAGYGETEAQVQSLSDYGSIKSVYVTVNGQAISATTSTDNYGYQLTYSNEDNYRAAVNVYNLPLRENTVQAWFFTNEYKYFNEVTEQIFDVTDPQPFILSQAPGKIEPAVANAMVELVQNGVRRRLRPPIISYYEIINNTTTFLIDNQRIWPDNSFRNKSMVRVYVNGRQLTTFDFDLDTRNSTVTVLPGILDLRDVVAVVGLPEPISLDPDLGIYRHFYDYDIVGNQLTLPDDWVSGEIRVLTYTDHDDMLMRTERFDGNPSRRYKISRPVLDINYVWVTVNGIPLTAQFDYEVLDDQVTIQISDRYEHTYTDDVVINSISSTKLSSTVLGYRIFNDMFNRTHFKRLSKQNSTYLTRPLSYTDTEIHVADASVLSDPVMSKKWPGVVLIDGERIEFFVKDGNILKQLRRSTLGTSPSPYSQENTKVLDQSYDQTIPYSETILRQYHVTTSSTGPTVLNTGTSSYTFIISTNTFVVNTGTQNRIDNDGIVLSRMPGVRAEDQVQIYYGGRPLRKNGIYLHDTKQSYDSPMANIKGTVPTSFELPNIISNDVKLNDAYVVTATNQVWVYTNSVDQTSINGFVYQGLNYVPPEFTITTSTQAVTLNVHGGIYQDVEIEIVKRQFERSSVWNTPLTTTTTVTLMDSDTVPAKFLQIRPAELPDIYYYGGSNALITSGGDELTDAGGAPLEGF